MPSDNSRSQPSSKVLEKLAFLAVIVFALGLTYAIYITQQTVNDIDAGRQAEIKAMASEINNSTSSDIPSN